MKNITKVALEMLRGDVERMRDCEWLVEIKKYNMATAIEIGGELGRIIRKIDKCLDTRPIPKQENISEIEDC